jgi:hypothetical protein
VGSGGFLLRVIIMNRRRRRSLWLLLNLFHLFAFFGLSNESLITK